MGPEQQTLSVLKGIRDFAEFLPSGKDSELFSWISERNAGIGGLISSGISTYMIWKQCEFV